MEKLWEILAKLDDAISDEEYDELEEKAVEAIKKFLKEGRRAECVKIAKDVALILHFTPSFFMSTICRARTDRVAKLLRIVVDAIEGSYSYDDLATAFNSLAIYFTTLAWVYTKVKQGKLPKEVLEVFEGEEGGGDTLGGFTII